MGIKETPRMMTTAVNELARGNAEHAKNSDLQQITKIKELVFKLKWLDIVTLRNILELRLLRFMSALYTGCLIDYRIYLYTYLRVQDGKCNSRT